MLGSYGMFFSQMAAVAGTTDKYSVTLNWTPTDAQFGPNLVCARAVDSTYLSSDFYCFTLLAGFESPSVVAGSGSPSGALSDATLAGNNGRITWTVQFNMVVSRPTKSRYIIFYHSNGIEAFRIDVSDAANAVYNADWVSFETDNAFSGSYYIVVGYGVGVLPVYCNPESDAENSWNFSAPYVPTTTIPTTITTENVNITMKCNREAFIILMSAVWGFFGIFHIFFLVSVSVYINKKYASGGIFKQLDNFK